MTDQLSPESDTVADTDWGPERARTVTWHDPRITATGTPSALVQAISAARS